MFRLDLTCKPSCLEMYPSLPGLTPGVVFDGQWTVDKNDFMAMDNTLIKHLL